MTIPSQKNVVSDESIAARRRKLIFRASRRGFLEMDLLMGAFARAHVPYFSEAEMDLFEKLLQVPDWDVYGWARNQSDPPAHLGGSVMEALRRFVW